MFGDSRRDSNFSWGPLLFMTQALDFSDFTDDEHAGTAR